MSRDPYQLDRRRVRAAFDAAVDDYDAVAVVQAEVLRRLLERLELFRVEVRRVLDAGCGTGRAVRPLLRRYRHADVIALDVAPNMAFTARARRRLLRTVHGVCADAAALPLDDASVDLVFSNLMLQWCNAPDLVFGEFRRVLRPGGLALFTTFGPDTLKELRSSWGAADGHTHVSRFVDMHDLGDALLRAGLVEPVMDVESLTLTYADVRSLMRDLKTMGAGNATAGRSRGLTGRRKLEAVERHYEQLRRDGRLPATWEVVYGHAWAGVDRTATAPGRGEAVVPLAHIGRRQ